MFSVVGIIGMVGIIINDSIVLVTTVDEYAQERGLIPAIIDGAADRLRPVMLTTMTTVLGLMPLLFEGSNQAEFLKPTVITLVYGLGVGMFLVLLVVPSLMAMQADVHRQVQSAKRALRGRRWAMFAPAGLGAVVAVALFAVLVAPVLLTGAPWTAVAAIMPALQGGFAVALGLFVVALALALALIYGGTILLMRVRRGV